MKHEFHNPVLQRPGHPDGMTVPEGYFDNFAARMADMLPVNDLEQQPVVALKPLTRWQRVRPYVYMAAMFAGVWCMMKMFSMIQSSSTDLSFDNNPVLTAALSNDEFVYDYVLDDYTEDQLLDDLYSDGVDAEDFSPYID